ncbi:hypothetical protein K435DRAFT_789863 [Dendrothele bispora CBS 962.96]|uniref:Uncharacterized protein n=1 Tax=Dendrothele bispora (strain CBS 962.96) TaxID=1314807 RepID=A0A4S8MRV4_DENBC|nr:hypothetical protein K435DRAFT_789863 [Dendrothele bispora CBS 962.96]
MSNLSSQLTLCVIITNVETVLGVTNGAHDEVVNIAFDSDEPDLGEDPVVKLKHLPKNFHENILQEDIETEFKLMEEDEEWPFVGQSTFLLSCGVEADEGRYEDMTSGNFEPKSCWSTSTLGDCSSEALT